MNNISKLALAAVMVTPAIAVANTTAPTLVQKQITPATVQGAIKLTEVAKVKEKAPAKVQEAQELITVAPPGKVTTLIQSGDAYQLYWGEPRFWTYTGIATEIVEGDDGFVYLKNPISQFTTDSYIKGVDKGDSYVFDLPHNLFPTSLLYGVAHDEHLSMLQYSTNDKYYLMTGSQAAIDAGLEQIPNQLVLKKGANGSFSFNSDYDESVIYGIINSVSEKWNGYAEISCTWTVFGDQLVTPPSGLQTTSMAYQYDETGHYVKVGYDGNDVYIQGLFEVLPDSWIKGTKEGNKVIIPTGQYLGYYDYDNSQTYCTTVSFETEEDPNNGNIDYYYTKTNELVFDLADDGTMTAKDQAFMYTPGTGNTYYYAMHNPTIKTVSSDLNPKPARPYDLQYFPGSYPNYPSLEFELPNTNVDGELLNPENLVYSIFIDDEQFVFQPDLYSAFEMPTRYIPYNFTDAYDFFVQDKRRKVYFYFTDKNNKYGVKLYHIDPTSGQIIGESEMASCTAKGSGVSTINADKAIASVKYYNLAGYEVANPDNGIYIQVTTYTDGTTTTSKVRK